MNGTEKIIRDALKANLRRLERVCETVKDTKEGYFKV